MKKRILVCALIISRYALCFGPEVQLAGISFFSPRSQSINTARHLVEIHPYIHIPCKHESYYAGSFIAEYAHSVRADRIAQTLFNSRYLTVTGSQIVNRGPQDVLADYFGLSPTFDALVTLQPHIQNAIFEFQGFVGFNNCLPGLFGYCYLTAALTKWDFQIREDIRNNGTDTPYPPGYMDIDAVTAPATSFAQALAGGITFGQMQNPMQYGLVCGSHSKGTLAEAIFGIGYDFFLSTYGHAGLSCFIGIPTGNRPYNRYFFEPLCGNGKQLQLGLGFTGQVLLWEKDGEQTLYFFADVNLSHLCRARQYRSFDFCLNGFGSRFILLKTFDDTGNYTGQLTPAINHTTLPCHVSTDIQMDLSAMFGYNYNSFLFDIGYNGWLRSKERMHILGCIPQNMFGFKGLEPVYAGGALSNLTQPDATLTGNYSPGIVDIYVNTASLNPRSAASPCVVTHKFFANVGYAPQEARGCEWVIPFIGFGGEIEFLGTNLHAMVSPNHTTLSQWGAWVKGGIAF